MKKKAHIYRQAGAISYRLVDARLDVLMITTSSGKNITIPKGLIDPGRTPIQTVHQEAFEEAGIRGRVGGKHIGKYTFSKWGGLCKVKVFIFKITTIYDHWPEAHFRKRIWTTPRRAAAIVSHSALAELILGLEESIGAY